MSESAWRQGTSTTVELKQREWTRLSEICDMEIEYQISDISESRCKNPLRFIFGVFIP